jgi:hypothetical protein
MRHERKDDDLCFDYGYIPPLEPDKGWLRFNWSLFVQWLKSPFQRERHLSEPDRLAAVRKNFIERYSQEPANVSSLVEAEGLTVEKMRGELEFCWYDLRLSDGRIARQADGRGITAEKEIIEYIRARTIAKFKGEQEPPLPTNQYYATLAQFRELLTPEEQILVDRHVAENEALGTDDRSPEE